MQTFGKDFERNDMPLILVVDDGQELHGNVSQLLQGTGYRTLFAEDATTAISIAEKYQPHIVILDIQLSHGSVELCRELKSRLHTADIPIIFVAANEPTDEMISKCFEAGARDLITKPLTKTNLWSRLRVALRDQSLREAYRLLAIQDHFTQLANRRQSILEIQSAVSIARREQSESVLVLGDIDDFALVNERYGYEFGDEVVLTFSRLLRRFVTSECRAGRLNGDTMCLVLRNTTQRRALTMVERICQTFAAVAFDAGTEPKHFSASFGLAWYNGQPDDLDADDFLCQADIALFAAKEMGAGKICAHWTLDPNSMPVVAPDKRHTRRKMRKRTNRSYVGVVPSASEPIKKQSAGIPVQQS